MDKKARHNEVARACRLNNLDKFKDREKRRRSGLSKEDYYAAVQAQPNCAICGVLLTDPGPAMDSRCADHDHQTNKFRGFLCRRCNLALGNFRDSIELMQSAIAYLKGHLCVRTVEESPANAGPTPTP